MHRVRNSMPGRPSRVVRPREAKASRAASGRIWENPHVRAELRGQAGRAGERFAKARLRRPSVHVPQQHKINKLQSTEVRGWPCRRGCGGASRLSFM